MANLSVPTRLYLGLLKRSLTNTLYKLEPDTDQESEAEFVHEFIQHYIKGTWRFRCSR